MICKDCKINTNTGIIREEDGVRIVLCVKCLNKRDLAEQQEKLANERSDEQILEFNLTHKELEIITCALEEHIDYGIWADNVQVIKAQDIQTLFARLTIIEDKVDSLLTKEATSLSEAGGVK